ncbi:Ltp family lipoprotein [Enterococcus lactis]|uniref:Ltp family lipoprotein n=1 Tax=Enterococcus lactis TaxID=357441 RepID=UPI001CDC396D|nr:Ltp family lipoprotein [Enterococcus lactis]UBX37853.1 Ltp family lipoprotein [Enterococcus lactis]
MAKKVMGQDGKMYKVKKPFYKRVWFWLLAVVVVFIAIGSQGGSDDAKNTVVETTKESVTEVSSAESVAESTVVEEETETTETTETTIEEVTQEESVPREYRNALSKAESYLGWAGMSEQGLREQLEFEEYPSDAIDYALANVDVDYNEQALAKAESYDDWASMSDSQLYDQLIFEGFTDEQAQYALDNLPQ